LIAPLCAQTRGQHAQYLGTRGRIIDRAGDVECNVELVCAYMLRQRAQYLGTRGRIIDRAGDVECNVELVCA
jgi:hypothetical protein